MSEGRTLRLRSGQPWSGEDTQGCCVSLTGFQLAKTRHYGPHEGFTWETSVQMECGIIGARAG